MKLTFDFKFKGFDGKASEQAAHAGEILGNLLASDTQNKHNAVRYFGWALKFHNKEGVDLEKADQTLLKEFIESAEGLTALMRAQLLEHIEEAKENADSKNKSKGK